MKSKPFDQQNFSTRQHELIAKAQQQVQDTRAQLRDDDSNSSVAFVDSVMVGYERLTEIHRGGQGVVYQAIQKSTGRKVAIKVIKKGSNASEADRTRFELEVKVLGQIHHPSIVTIHDSGLADGHFFFVMDYIRGQPLDIFMAGGERSVLETLQLFEKICLAVNAAHLHGVIHRDLKPGNIRVDEHGEPHVLDFGLAKVAAGSGTGIALQTAMTVTGQFVGSLPWASPEQVEGPVYGVDLRTDVYSLGVILFHMLTGRFPYDVAANIRNVVDDILNAESPKPSSIRSEITGEVDTIVLKCLSKDPERRYQTAGEVARDIHRYLVGEPIEAKQNSTWYVFTKTAKRHRLAASLVVSALVLVLFSVVALAVVNRRESQLREQAQLQVSIAEAVNDFFNVDILGAASPEALGRRVTVREALDVAASRMEERFEDLPLVRAAIHATLGSTYMDLGDWPVAVVHATKALRLRRDDRGDEHPDTLQSMILAGRLFRRLGRLDEAEDVLTEAVETAKRTLDPGDELTTNGMNNLAVLYGGQGRINDAFSVNREVLEIRQRTLGDEHPDTLTSMHNEAYYHQVAGRAQVALRGFERVYEARRRVLGEEHPNTLVTMGNLGFAYLYLKRYDKAETLLRRQFELVRQIEGERHPSVIISLMSLADLESKRSRFEEAEGLLYEAMDIQRHITGEEHTDMAECYVELGRLFSRQERFEEANTWYKKAIALRKKDLGSAHPFTLRAIMDQATMYVSWQRLAEAAFTLENVIPEIRARGMDGAGNGMWTMIQLASVYAKLDRKDDAIAVLIEAQKLTKSEFDENHPIAQSISRHLQSLMEE